MVIGISLKKKYPNYDWDSEMIVVKQSLPVIVTGIISMITLITPILLNWFLIFRLYLFCKAVSVILLAISFRVYRKMTKLNFI